MKSKRFIPLLLLSAALVLLFSSYCQVQRKRPARIYYKRYTGKYAAHTIPPFGIIVNERYKGNENLIAHENVHWKQFQREGFMPFIVGYTGQNIVNGYDCNLYEIEARYIESDECKCQYTDCVRNGRAKTVHNPDFRK